MGVHNAGIPITVLHHLDLTRRRVVPHPRDVLPHVEDPHLPVLLRLPIRRQLGLRAHVLLGQVREPEEQLFDDGDGGNVGGQRGIDRRRLGAQVVIQGHLLLAGHGRGCRDDDLLHLFGDDLLDLLGHHLFHGDPDLFGNDLFDDFRCRGSTGTQKHGCNNGDGEHQIPLRPLHDLSSS